MSMTVETFMSLLAFFSVVTGLVVEASKKVLAENISYNVYALIVALFVGALGMSAYYYINDIIITMKDCVFIVLMGISNGLCAMLGYDKVIQALNQRKDK